MRAGQFTPAPALGGYDPAALLTAETVRPTGLGEETPVLQGVEAAMAADPAGAAAVGYDPAEYLRRARGGMVSSPLGGGC